MGQLESRLERLEKVLHHKGKPTHDEYIQASGRSRDRVRAHIEYRIDKARGIDVPEPAIDQNQEQIDQDIIKACGKNEIRRN